MSTLRQVPAWAEPRPWQVAAEEALLGRMDARRAMREERLARARRMRRLALAGTAAMAGVAGALLAVTVR